jgi:hypothetical protein
VGASIKKSFFMTDRRVEALGIISILVFQFLWLIVQPPFSSVDEVHHASMAYSVTHYRVIAPINVSNGPNEITSIKTIQWSQPDSFAPGPPGCYLAQGPAYTPNVCRKFPWDSNKIILIKNGNSQYFPIYYLVVGIPTLFAHGEIAYYGMRLFGLFLSFSLILIAARNIKKYFRTSSLFLIIAFTPMAMQGAGDLAPLSVETAAALAFASFFIRFRKNKNYLSSSSAVFSFIERVLMIVSFIFMTSTRPTGMYWGILITILMVLHQGRKSFYTLLSKERLTFLSLFLFQLFIIGFNQLHKHETGLFLPPGSNNVARIIFNSFENTFEYFRNSVGIFGQTGVYLPDVIYAFIFGFWVLLVLNAFRYSNNHVMWLFFITVLVGFIFIPNLVAMKTFYMSYQGRYALPFLSVGLLFLTMEARKFELLFGTLLMMLANGIGLVVSIVRFTYGLMDVGPNAHYQLAHQSVQTPLPILRFSYACLLSFAPLVVLTVFCLTYVLQRRFPVASFKSHSSERD